VTEENRSTSPGMNSIDGSRRSPSLGVIKTRKDGRVRVAFMGELDGATAPSARPTLAEVAQNLVGDLELDIGLLTIADATGLSLLVTLHKQLAARGRKLVMVAPTAGARRLFEITGLNQILSIEPHGDVR
jgi:anti-sigma B factor antagonist